MGVLTEFIAATESDTNEIVRHLDRARWQTVDAKGHSELTMAALWTVLDPSVDFEDVESEFTPLSDDNQDGPWVSLIPPRLTALIQQIDQTQIQSVHQEWCQHEELEVDDDGDAQAVLDQLHELIKLSRSLKPKDSLLMWISL